MSAGQISLELIQQNPSARPKGFNVLCEPQDAAVQTSRWGRYEVYKGARSVAAFFDCGGKQADFVTDFEVRPSVHGRNA